MSGRCEGSFETIAGLLGGIDCRVAAYVEAAYRGLYGPFGWLGPVLTAALTIYVALFAFRLLEGRGKLSVSGLTRRLLAVGVVVAMSSNWAAYQTAAANVLSGGGEEIADRLLRATGGGAAADVGTRLDGLFTDLTELASRWGTRGASSAPADPAATPVAPAMPSLDAVTAVNMLWMSALVLALGSAGVVVVAKVVLAFLLALGPLFFLLALFPQTRGLFEGWLRTAAANALIPLFALAATAAMLPVVEPIVAAAVESQARGVADVKPVFTLALAALVFGILMFQIVAMTTRLAGAWRLPSQEADDAAPDAASVAASPSTAAAAGHDPRITAIVAAVGRDAAPLRADVFPSRGAEMLALAAQPALAADGAGRRVAAGYRGFGAARMQRRPA